jgi:hypothetical protein
MGAYVVSDPIVVFPRRHHRYRANSAGAYQLPWDFCRSVSTVEASVPAGISMRVSLCQNTVIVIAGRIERSECAVSPGKLKHGAPQASL